MSYLPEVGAALVAAFNKQWPSGTRCTLVKDLGQAIETRTRSEAWTLGHGAAVVLVEGVSGGYALERVIPHAAKVSPTDERLHAIVAKAMIEAGVPGDFVSITLVEGVLAAVAGAS